jgi:hypothetical protein
MSDDHGGGGSKSDIWWFLGIMAMLFGLWVMGGGPERAQKENAKPIIHGPVSSPRTTN